MAKNIRKALGVKGGGGQKASAKGGRNTGPRVATKKGGKLPRTQRTATRKR